VAEEATLEAPLVAAGSAVPDHEGPRPEPRWGSASATVLTTATRIASATSLRPTAATTLRMTDASWRVMDHAQGAAGGVDVAVEL
jgi:hypothetical protein